MVSLLEANGIGCFVRGGNFASLLPGLQIGSYNIPTIMVPDSDRQEALELLSVFASPPDHPKSTTEVFQPMNTSPAWFKIVAVVALLWNLLGCIAFFSDLRLSPDDLAQLPEAQQALYAARPGWAVAATGVAVFGGVIGCIGLLLRRRWAFPILVLSLAGIVVQDFGLFVLADGASLAGPVAVVMQGIVLAVGIGLVLLSRKGIARGWLA